MGRGRGRLGRRVPHVLSEPSLHTPQRAPPACPSHNSPLSPCPSVSLCPLCISLPLFVSLSISVSPSPSYVSSCVLSHISPYFSALLEPSPLPLSSHWLWCLQVSLLDSCEEPPGGGVGGSPPPPLAQTLAHAQGHRDERLHGPPAPPRARSAAAKVAWLGPCPLWTMLPHCQQSGWGRGRDPKGLSHWASERGYAGPYPSLWPSPDFMQDAGVHGGGHQGGGKEENK